MLVLEMSIIPRLQCTVRGKRRGSIWTRKATMELLVAPVALLASVWVQGVLTGAGGRPNTAQMIVEWHWVIVKSNIP